MKILVVEDEHKIAQSIRKGLEQELYTVDLAFAGGEGLDLASTGDYDLIVLDLMLPGLGGIEICRELRRQSVHTPILILTAKGQVSDKVVGFSVGADDYLTKPFAFEELLARIRALTRRPQTLLPSVLTIEDLELDTISLEVKRAGRKISLSSLEFSLLEYLMRHPYKILTKEQTINHVWNYDSDVLPNTVEAYVGYLRNKIDKPFPKKAWLIQTIRGFGYKLGKGK